MPRCEPCHCDETDFQNEDSGDGASRRRRRPSSVASDEIEAVDKEVGHVVRWRPLVSSWPYVDGLFTALVASHRNVIQCIERRARVGERQSWSGWVVPGRLATVRHYEARGRWEERLLLWKVRDEEWVVTAPDWEASVEELRSRGTYGRRVVGDVFAVQPGADEAVRERLFSRARVIAHQDQAA